jgi:hypothetical protein
MAGLALIFCLLSVYGLFVALALADYRLKKWRRRRQRRAPVRSRIRALGRLLVFLARVPISPVLVLWRILERGALAIANAELALKDWRRRRQAANNRTWAPHPALGQDIKCSSRKAMSRRLQFDEPQGLVEVLGSV